MTESSKSVLVWPSSLPLCSDDDSNITSIIPDGYVIGWEEVNGEDTKTIIAAGILSTPIERVRDQLQFLKEIKYPCKDRACLSCKFVIQDLKVVAKWIGNRKAASAMRSNKKDCDTSTITLTENGPILDHKSVQVIAFDPCINAEDCFRHDANLTSTYKSMKVVGSAHNTHYSDLRRLLLRISETETIMNDLKEAPTAHFNENTGLEKSGFNATRSIDDEKSVENFSFTNRSLSFHHMALEKQRHCEWMEYYGHYTHALLGFVPILSLISMFKDDFMSNDPIVGIHFTPREIKSNHRFRRYNMMASRIIDSLLGILWGVFLIYRKTVAIEFALAAWNLINVQLLGNNIGWLETFPVGFKLNVPLTRVMGQNILSFTKLYERLLFRIISPLNVSVRIQILGWISIIFGFRTCISLVYDLAKVATGHTQLIHCTFRSIFRTQISLFSSLWHLFRGKKKNVLRQRSDTLEYDFMQLFLGMILFATCLFLFTTVLVYFFFFSLVQLVVSCSIGILRSFYICVTCFPFGDVISSAFVAGGLRSKIAFAPISDDDDKDGAGMSFLQIKSSSLTPGWLLIEAVKSHFKLLR